MIYIAHVSLSNELLALPETGMGYQIIEAIKPGGYFPEQFVVYNSELIVDLDHTFSDFKNRIFNEGYAQMFSKADSLSLSNPRLVGKIPNEQNQWMSKSKKVHIGRHYFGLGATDCIVQNANGVESYVRLSAYENDNRIDFANKRFKPGTFSTTVNDYETCRIYNDEPVDRYALPNDERIKWTFYVNPTIYDTFQEGIVQTAFEHEGGGIEIFFANGTSENSYYRKIPYLQLNAK